MRPTVACSPAAKGSRSSSPARIEKTAAGYRIEVRAVTPGKTEPLSIAEATASDKAQVLGAVGRVAERIRAALGDTTLGGAQAETFTTVSLEAVRAYTVAQDLSVKHRDAEAVVQYQEALRHDPEFGRAYSGLAASFLRLGRREEAQKYWDEAFRRTDRMTDREKLRTFGGYYLGIARNYEKAIETYEELVAKFPSDSAGYNNLALAYFSLLNFGKALEHGRKAIEIYPKTYQVPRELRALCHVRRGLPDRCHDRAGTHQGRPEDGRGISAAGDGSAHLGR